MWARPKTLTLRFVFLLVLAPLTLFADGRLRAATSGERALLSKNAAAAAFGKLPLSFEANQGQTDKQVKFVSRGSGYALFLTSTEAVLSLKTESGRHAKKDSVLPIARTQKPLVQKSAVLRMRLERANSNAKVSGIDELAGKSNYFIGNDAAKWRSNIPTFGRVKYQQVYSGVDLVYYGNQRELEYDFVLAPGADPRQIELSFDGARRLRLDADGDLIVSIAGGEVIEPKPVIYQDIGGRRQRVAGGYALRNGRTVGFKLAGYDVRRSLTIDPSVVYSTYLGGNATDVGYGIALDSSANAYVTGYTQSSNFPTTAGAFQTTLGGSDDAFISKLNSSGSMLVYSTYLGGNKVNVGYGIAVDSSGNAYVTGQTASSDFPTTAGAFQTTFGRNGESPVATAFVSKLNSSGSALIYSTYLGGSYQDGGHGIALDSSGNAYVTGYTYSSNFPTTSSNFPATVGAFQAAIGADDVGTGFVSKLDSRGSMLVYSTYLGGSTSDSGNGIAVDSSGNAYVIGATSSSDFPTTAGAFQTTLLASEYGSNAFISKLNSVGSTLVYSTYLGGSTSDYGYGIAVDSSGNAYVTGATYSSDFPTTAGAFQTTSGSANGNAFVSKLNSSGSALVYSSYLGGNASNNGNGFGDYGSGIALDSSGNAYVTGQTTSSDFPTTMGAFQTTKPGILNAFVSKLNSRGSMLVYSTYLGGSTEDYGHGIAVDSSGNAYVAGSTTSSNFPTTAGAFQTTLAGTENAFVSKISFGIAFSHFGGSLKIDPDAGVFYLSGGFTLGPGGSINPLKEQVTFSVGSYSVTLPPGSFVQYKTGYVYQKTVNHIFLCIYIKFTSTPGSYILLANRIGGTLNTTTSPVPVSLSIGDNSGTTQMSAKFD